MNINRLVLVYTAVVTTGLLISSARSAFTPNPNNKLEFEIGQLKESINKLSENNTGKDSLTQEVNSLKDQIAQAAKEESANKPAGAPEESVLGKTSSTLGQIKVAPDFGTIDAYDDTSFSSAIAGKLDPNKNYSYTKKQDNWLLVELDNGKEGWVNNKLVVQTQGSP